MDWRIELKILLWLLAGFGFFYFLPVEQPAVAQAIQSAFALAHWYAQEHVLLCLIPAFFIAGGITVFVSQNAVLQYFGAQADRRLAYGVASVSGSG
jgi:uncharacterized membrane protein YraQ (UPF0718 family)